MRPPETETAAPGATGSGGKNERELGPKYSSSAPIHALLDRLDGVKQTGDGRWLARCPAHDDRTPSLSIRECDDGRILLHDFAGCEVASVLAAVGLELRDLFPERPEQCKPIRPGERWIPRDVLRALSGDLLFALIALEHFNRGETLSDDDIDRLSRAEKRLRAAAREVGINV